MLVSDVGWFSELPDGAVLKIPVDDYEVATIAGALELAADHGAELGSAAARVRARASTTSAAPPTPTPPRSRRRPAARPSPSAVLMRIAEGAAGIGFDDPTSSPGSRARQVSCDGLADREQATDAPADRKTGQVSACPEGRAGAGSRASSRSRSPSGSLLGHRMVAPWIMVDEIVYSELAKNVAAHGEFLVRGVPSHGYGFVYPVLIAPAWALFTSIPSAYAAAKAINAVLMSLAAIPAYFLARRILPARLALIAAALTVARAGDALHGRAHDRERLLPDLPRASRCCSSSRSSGRRCAGRSACSPSARSRSRRARRRWRSSPRSRRRRSCSASSSGAAGAGRPALRVALRPARRRRASSRSPPPWPAAARR